MEFSLLAFLNNLQKNINQKAQGMLAGVKTQARHVPLLKLMSTSR
jgi:HEAT repeat protein